MVIGGQTGIGMAIAQRLESRHHFDVVHTVGKQECDVRNDIHVENFFRHAEEEQSYDTIVYSAGVSYLEWLGAMDHGDLDKMYEVIDVNLTGFLRVMNTIVPGIPGADSRIAENPRKILVISSDAANRPMRTSAAYCASKAGLDMAVRCAARELGPYGWQINALSPGMTAPTGISDYVDKRVPEIRSWTPERAMHYEQSQEVVPGRMHPNLLAMFAVQMLFSPEHLNGSIITMNGGR